jgi:RNA-binding protein Tab2/Atab2
LIRSTHNHHSSLHIQSCIESLDRFKESMRDATSRPAFFDVRTPLKLPDALRGEKYAFVGLPVAEFQRGGGVNDSNIGVGKLCSLPEGIPSDSFIQGIVILTPRARALATWLAGTEVVGMSCDLRKRVMVMETDIDNEYLMAKLNDEQREEANIFEEGKEALGGLHFISVQQDENDDPAGFWLLRDLPPGI